DLPPPCDAPTGPSSGVGQRDRLECSGGSGPGPMSGAALVGPAPSGKEVDVGQQESVGEEVDVDEDADAEREPADGAEARRGDEGDEHVLATAAHLGAASTRRGAGLDLPGA